ncbi:MAG TPA: universal stress protein [Thermoleophilaceae bacterium]|nr:universal stress protein [Thermoleophilaceae bacterium]
MVTRERHVRRPREAPAAAAVGPVVLGTLSSGIDPAAERIAIESALDAGVPLIVVNVVQLPPCPRALAMGGPEALAFPHEEQYEAVRGTAERAAKFGLRVEHLRVSSPRPARALVQIAQERAAGLLVLGPERRRRIARRVRFRRAARAVRRSASCLVWIAGEAPAAAAG